MFLAVVSPDLDVDIADLVAIKAVSVPVKKLTVSCNMNTVFSALEHRTAMHPINLLAWLWRQLALEGGCRLHLHECHLHDYWTSAARGMEEALLCSLYSQYYSKPDARRLVHRAADGAWHDMMQLRSAMSAFSSTPPGRSLPVDVLMTVGRTVGVARENRLAKPYQRIWSP